MRHEVKPLYCGILAVSAAGFMSQLGPGRVKTAWHSSWRGATSADDRGPVGRSAEWILAPAAEVSIPSQQWMFPFTSQANAGACLKQRPRQALIAATSHTNDIHDPREIVSEHVQGHFGSNLRQASHQEVCCAHSHLT
jgi:hypothetical protein